MTGHLIGGKLSNTVLEHVFQSSVWYLFRYLMVLQRFLSQFRGYQLEACKSPLIFQAC